MVEPDPYENDPFFKTAFDSDDSEWNACIGRQGGEGNYLDGYIEAAIELTDAIISKKMFEKRDTLILPILYNARHAVELALKFATDQLSKSGVIENKGFKKNHDIKAYWDHLHGSAIGDEMLSNTIAALRSYIESLSRVDSDGQELRYHRNRDNGPSLANYSIANLKLIRTSLSDLEKLLSTLKYRILAFVDERATGSFSNRLSRRDLFEITRQMPPRNLWTTGAFDLSKAAIMVRYGLTNRQFSIALDRIQKSREMRAILGVESQLLHLDDNDIVWVVEQWRRVHPIRRADEVDGSDYFGIGRLEAMQEHGAVRKEVVKAIEVRLSSEALADLEAMFYVERDRVFSEYYETMVADALKGLAAVNKPNVEIWNLMGKTNFLSCLQGAAAKLGRLSLAERLMTM